MSTLANVGVFKWLELLFSILGLAFAISCKVCYTALIVIYAISLVYILIIIIVFIAGKSFFSSTVQAIFEVILGLALVIYTIVLIGEAGKDVMLVLAIITGFVLPALFFVTAYEKT